MLTDWRQLLPIGRMQDSSQQDRQLWSSLFCMQASAMREIKRLLDPMHISLDHIVGQTVKR